MTKTTGNHARNHEGSLRNENESGDGLPAAGRKPRSTSRQAPNHMSTAAGGGISPASAGESLNWRILPAKSKEDEQR
jgi:hypothetical protein